MKTLLCFATLALAVVRADDSDAPPSELASPDKSHVIRVEGKPMPGVDPDDFPFTLEVLAQGKVQAKYPTEGYLINAFWSDDGNYVAVNNRRGNSGDYAWVFSLRDGSTIRKPNDAETQPFEDRIVKKFPEYKEHIFFKRLTEAASWKNGTLSIKTKMSFEKINYLFTLIDTYKVEGDKLVQVGDVIEKKPIDHP